ncbi:MAG: GerMN domain-containing protein, partial [Eubacteriales bacterium]|nr:GerMN domain-containing protein [Eubacteriales bacterium]
MKKNKKTLLIVIGVIFLLIIAISITFMRAEKNDTKDTIPSTDTVENEELGQLDINIYYLDSTKNELFAEKRKIENTKNEVFINLLDFMKETPKTATGISVVPKDLNILTFEVDDRTLKVNFSKEYNNMEETEEIFFRSAFIWTVTELPDIKDIEISVEGKPITKGDGEPMGLLSRENIVLNPTISPEKVEYEQVILYFSDEEELSLVPENRLVEVKQRESLETQIVEQLILGPKEKGHFATIPAETKIRNIKTEGGICYVDLSNEFISKSTGGSSAELFTIYSIVNSLTELDEVNKVQFLIEGEKVSDYKGSLDISKPLD